MPQPIPIKTRVDAMSRTTGKRLPTRFVTVMAYILCFGTLVSAICGMMPRFGGGGGDGGGGPG
eukprot:3884610-Alexandrium_andersonii.AAC.1